MSPRKRRATRIVQPAMTTTSSSTSWFVRHGASIAVFAVLVFVAAVRLRLAGVPLERDEGEYAYAGQLILQGIPPYRLVYNMKFPGAYYAYSLVLAVFGQTAWGIHVGLLVVNAATALLLFLVGRRLLGQFPGAIATVAFAILSLDRWIMGVFAHATHFVLLPALAGLFLLLHAMDSRRWPTLTGAGVLLGLAVLMKQHAAVFVPLGVGWWLWSEARRSPWDARGAALGSGALLAGAAIPFVTIAAVFAAQGVFGRFWFWTFEYAKTYISEVSLSQAWPFLTNAWAAVTQATLQIWLLGAAGAGAVWLSGWPSRTRVFLTSLLVASFVAICPGFYFREHYFILLLPAAALFVAVAVVALERGVGRLVPVNRARIVALAAFAACIGWYVVEERAYLFSMPLRDVSRIRYGNNPFIEAPEIANYIREKTDPTDRIAVLGSEPEIYFYANRKSATGYIYAYPLMEPQPYAPRMQDEMIQEVEAAHPKYLVFIGVRSSWLHQPDSDLKIVNWTERYTGACYETAGIADIHSMEETTMRWDGDVAEFEPRSQAVVYTFRRKSDAPCVVEH